MKKMVMAAPLMTMIAILSVVERASGSLLLLVWIADAHSALRSA